MSFLDAAKAVGKYYTPGAKSVEALRKKKYKDAAKHAVSDAAYWSTLALPDHGVVSGHAVKYATNKVLFPKHKEKEQHHWSSNLPGVDREGGKKKAKKTVRKIKECVRDFGGAK